MKILLAAVNAKYIHSNLAVYDLYAYAEEFSEYIVLKEYTINQQIDDIMRDIYKEQPDVICFSCYIWNRSVVKELIDNLSKVLINTEFYVGGPEVSYHASEFLKKNSEVTGVLKGEGEKIFKALAAAYVNDAKGNLSKIKGLCIRTEKGEIIDNGFADLLDLSEVPFVYDDLRKFENKIIYYESSRGCPFSCSYCLSSIDKKLRFRSMDMVKRELQHFLDRNVKQVKFVDRTFNCRHDHAYKIWKYILEHDNGITNFHFEVSADLLNEEELKLLSRMRPGLIQLEIGVQSTKEETLQAINRYVKFEKLANAVRTIKSFHNIHQHLDLIAGLPYEDYNRFQTSFNDIYELRPEQLQLGFLKVLKGTEMEVHETEYDLVRKAGEPYEVLSTRWISYEDILKLKSVESMVEIYYNSGQFRQTMEFLLGYFKNAFSMYRALAKFYERKEYDLISHSRIRRYEILLEFAEDYDGIDRRKLIDEMMIDLYLRENLKSRPKFAPDQKEYDEKIWEYRRNTHVPKTAHIEVLNSGKIWKFDYTEREPFYHNALMTEITNEMKGEQ